MHSGVKQVGHFTIEQVLGRGGMGVVYLAKDEVLNRSVALKVLSEYDLPDKERRSRFLREARAAASIRHPNVATIYEVGETPDGSPYIAMEYCEGSTLANVVRGKFDPASFTHIALQIAEGLAAAHKKDVVHRDIKTANIMIEPDGSAKILDFGLAKVPDSGARDFTWASTGNFFGTVPYLSPEQARGLAADRRSDLFSLGVVYYEMATGKLPFNADNPLSLLEKIRDEEPEEFGPISPEIPPQVLPIIARLLQKDPKERYQSADEVAADLVPLSLNARTAKGRLTGSLTPSSKLPRTISRSSFELPVIIGVTLAILAVVGLILTRNRETSSKASVPAARSGPIHSVAVLPFQNLAGASTDEFLSVGLADALVTRLQQIASLQVRPTSAVLEYQKSKLDAKTAGSRLKVEGVVEGRFVSDGANIRVNLQLTDSRTGYGVWAQSVDGKRSDLIALMDQVSSKAAAALNAQLQQQPSAPFERAKPRTNNAQAYEHYLKARALIGNMVPAQSAAQVEHLKKAIELDPEFAAAYADLAIALSLRQVRGFARDLNTYREAEWYARQAVRLDPNLAEAHLALGETLVRFPDRYRESLRETLAAVRLNPNDPEGLYALVSLFISTGEFQKSTCAAERLISLDPTSNEVKARGYWNVNAVDPEGSIELAAIALASPETELAGRDIRALGYLLLGNANGAEADAKRATELVPDHYIGKSLHAMVAALRGDRRATEAALESMRKDGETNHWAALRFALCYSVLGDRDKAIEWIQRAQALGNHSWYYLIKHPWLQNIQQEPEFQKVVSKMKGDLDDVRDDAIGVYGLICPPKPTSKL